MFSNSKAAKFAAQVMYAWDMCNADIHCISPHPDPRIIESGWTVAGYITGQDNIIKVSSTIQRKLLKASNRNEDQVCYGFIAYNFEGDYIVVLRGTNGAEEWFDDFDFFLRQPEPPLQGLVDSGFYDIYQTLKLNGNTALPAAIVQIIGSSNITILGHSLGSALATYLAAELAHLLPPTQLNTYLFASPRPGDSQFSAYFDAQVKHYQLFNYQNDIVPLVPPLGYSGLPKCTMLKSDHLDLIISPDKKCCHHIICYIALLDTLFFRHLITQPNMTDDDKDCSLCITSCHIK